MKAIATILGCLLAAAPAIAQGSAKLAVGPDAGGYLCPDGRQLYVKSCYDNSPDSTCGIVNMHLPMQNGFQRESAETRSKLTPSVAACKIYPLEFRDGKVSLVLPKQQAAPASPAVKPAPTQTAKPAPKATAATMELVRISSSGVQPAVLYVHLGSITPSKNLANANEIWALQVFPNGSKEYPGARGVWSVYAVTCKQSGLVALMDMPIDERGKETAQGTTLPNKTLSYAKGSPGDRIVQAACGSPPRGPRLPSEAVAFADAATPLTLPGPKHALTRITAPGKAPAIYYIDITSAKETGQKGLNSIWSFQVFTEPHSAFPGTSAVWSRYEVVCVPQFTTRLTDIVELDRQGKALKAQNIDAIAQPVAKGKPGEKTAIAACKTEQVSGPMFITVASAIADAFAAEPPKTAAKSAALAAPPAPRALAKLRLPETEAEKKFFESIKTNQLQAAVTATQAPPGGKPVPVGELTDKQGMTALHWAAANSNAGGIRFLLDKRSELDLADEKGRTPLKIALDNKDTRAMTILLDRGASARLAWAGHDDELKGVTKTSELVEYLIKNAVPAGN